MNSQAPSSLLPPSSFVAVSGATEFADTVLQIVSTARFHLALMSVDLDRNLFGTSAFAEGLRNFILQHRRARLRVLVHEPAKAVRNSVRLVELGRLLSSRIEFRTVPVEDRKMREEFMIADERALLYRSTPEQLDAKYYADAPMVARSHLRAFETLWSEASVAREMSALKI
ncbi:MAG: DUF7931 domain-containing protein [Panacagrimonas sp.]